MKIITSCRMAEKLTRNLLASVLMASLLTVLYTEDARAVPAFARKYDMTCNACHTRQPRLNTFGQRFLENGYQLPGTQDGGTTGKDLYGGPSNGVTLDSIDNFLAVRLRADIQQASFKEPTEATDKAEVIFPNVINLFFAGTATKNISFFLEGEYATQEGHGAGLIFERAFMVFDNLGGYQVANVKVGIFDPSAFFSFPTHRQQLNPIPPNAHTDEFPPEVNRVPLLPLAFSSKMWGLTNGPSSVGATTGNFDPMGMGPVPTYDDQGDDDFAILPFQPYFYNAPFQKGVSVHGRPFGSSFLYQVGVAQNESAEDERDVRWDPYIMLRYDMTGSAYSAFQVSGFYYSAGKAARATLKPPPLGGEIIFSENVLDWERFGIGARWQYKFLDIYGTVIWDEIDKPDFGNAVVNTGQWETKAKGISLEADWLVNSKWLVGLRYDTMETGGLSVLPTPFVTAGDAKVNQDATFVGFIAKYYPVPNVAVYARAHFNLESSQRLPANIAGGMENPGNNLRNMYTVGVDMAF